MGFNRSPDIEFPNNREGWSKEEFWSAITSERDAKEFKVRLVQHLSLRLTLRVLSHTLFARGDTVSRALDDELKLLDAMLCDPAEKLNPGLIMVAHWENVRDSNYSGGKITMGAYVTHLGRAFNLGFADFEKATGPSLINLDYFIRSKFVRVQGRGNNKKYSWIIEGSQPVDLPLGTTLLPNDQSTWMVPGPTTATSSARAAPNSSRARPRASQAAQDDSQEEAVNTDALTVPNFFPGIAHPYFPPAEWYTIVTGTLGDLARLSNSNLFEIRELRRLSEDNSQCLDRLEKTANQFYNRTDTEIEAIRHDQWRQEFFAQNGYWPDDDC